MPSVTHFWVQVHSSPTHRRLPLQCPILNLLTQVGPKLIGVSWNFQENVCFLWLQLFSTLGSDSKAGPGSGFRVFPPVIVLVGRPAWEGHSLATAGGLFVYFLCLHPEPISGTGLDTSLCYSSTDLTKPWVMSTMCQERTVVVTRHLAYLPGSNPDFFGYTKSFLLCPTGNCPYLALRVSITYCSVCSVSLGVIRKALSTQILLIWESANWSSFGIAGVKGNESAFLANTIFPMVSRISKREMQHKEVI